MAHWLLEYHPDFEEGFEEWLFAYDHLHANVYPSDHDARGDLDVIDSLLPDKSLRQHIRPDSQLRHIHREYLIQKEQGEVDVAYDERGKLTAYTPYFPYAVTSLAGMFFDAQDSLRPEWQPEDAEEGFGDPEDPDSIAYKLESDWDGSGTSFATALWQTAVDLIALGEVWSVVEGVRRDPDTQERMGEAAVKTHTPLNAENWIEDGDSRLIEAKVRVEQDTRTTLKEPEEGSARAIKWLFYDQEGWERYILEPGESTLATRLDDEDNIELYATSDRQQRILQVYRVEIPVRGNPGYNAARAANQIFNLESGLSFQLWYSSYAKFLADMIDEDGNVMDAWEDLKQGFINGENVLVGKGQFQAPPSDNADIKDRWIEKLVERFFRTFYQQFGDAARERTATEIRQESRSGVQAYLVLLAHALERYVNRALWRLEQVYFPERPDLWGQAQWTAQKDFDPVDLEEQVQQDMQAIMPQGRMPMVRSTIKQALIRWHEAKDYELPEEDELDAAIDSMVSREAQAQSAMQDFGFGG